MAETLLSPGVLARENDQSQVVAGPIQAGAAILGPTVKGPVGIPTMVTSYSQYVNTFGTTFVSGSEVKSFLTSISAYNYFNNGGASLLVTRITSGSFTPASSSVANSTTTEGGAYTTGSFTVNTAFTDGLEARVTLPNSTLYRFVASGNPIPEDDVDGKLYFFSTGSTVNETATNLGAELVTALSGLFTVNTSSAEVQFTASAYGTTYNSTTVATGSGGTFSTQATLNGGVAATGTGVAFTLKTFSEGTIMNSAGVEDSNGALTNGSSDNVRWEVVANDTQSGTFDLTIRRGNDITDEKVVLETWTNLSLDPKAPNYISKVIGDTYYTVDTSDTTPYVKPVGTYLPKSKYVYVSAVNSPTPDYFDNAGGFKSAYTASLPNVASGSFGGADGIIVHGSDLYYENITGNERIQGVNASDYDQSIDLLSNQDEYQFNSITAPGLIIGQSTSTITKMINMVQSRGDALAVVDPAVYGATLATMTANAATYNSSYAATYAPWLQTTDPDSGQIVWVPASTMIPGVYAYNDSVSEAWFAPAGLNRGGLATVVRPERKLSQANRDTLYQGRVNPIASFPGAGTVVFGQKTLQKKASALDRINVRRLLIELKSYISQVSDNLVFEQNTIATRNAFLSQVNPYLESVQQRQGLYAFRVIMDDSNNTADVIDRNQLVGQIYIQPTKTAEFIYLDFNILPTGATFPA